MPETDFLRALARRSGCGLLLDVNNVVVSAANHGFDPRSYLATFPVDHVGEIHLAGHAVLGDPEAPLLVDTHDRPVPPEVWDLYHRLITRLGPLPTLIEWDSSVPAWPILAAEVARAEALLRAAGDVRVRVA